MRKESVGVLQHHLAFCQTAEKLHKDDDGGEAACPDEKSLDGGDRLLLSVGLLQALVVAEEPSVEKVKGAAHLSSGSHLRFESVISNGKDLSQNSNNISFLQICQFSVHCMSS